MPKDMNEWPNITARTPVGGRSAPTSELHEARHKAREAGLEFLNVELEMAETFLDVAETTSNADASRRNILNAVKALEAIGRFIEHLSPELPQRQFLEQRTAELRTRLMACDSRLQAHD